MTKPEPGLRIVSRTHKGGHPRTTLVRQPLDHGWACAAVRRARTDQLADHVARMLPPQPLSQPDGCLVSLVRRVIIRVRLRERAKPSQIDG